MASLNRLEDYLRSLTVSDTDGFIAQSLEKIKAVKQKAYYDAEHGRSKEKPSPIKEICDGLKKRGLMR